MSHIGQERSFATQSQMFETGQSRHAGVTSRGGGTADKLSCKSSSRSGKESASFRGGYYYRRGYGAPSSDALATHRFASWGATDRFGSGVRLKLAQDDCHFAPLFTSPVSTCYGVPRNEQSVAAFAAPLALFASAGTVQLHFRLLELEQGASRPYESSTSCRTRRCRLISKGKSGSSSSERRANELLVRARLLENGYWSAGAPCPERAR